MGLTVHYQLQLPADLTAPAAEQLVRKVHRQAATAPVVAKGETPDDDEPPPGDQ